MGRLALALFLLPVALSPARSETTGADLLRMAGVKGGLVVHLGCGDGALTAGLHGGNSYLVHGLDADPGNIAKARKRLLSEGLYGKVSVALFKGKRLPYMDNSVNLLVISKNLPGVGHDEMNRVLVPGGVVMTKGDGWRKRGKLVPAEIDEWTHFLYDASGNAVSKDRRVGSPRRIQWWAGPKRMRNHDALASLSAITSSNGRIFYIIDEGPVSLVHRPSKWKLVARDAFNGVLLWKRDISTWVTHLFLFRAGPVQMTRRLVSVGDRVYVTLGLDAPVCELDAATGETIRTFKGSEKTEELIWHDNVLLVVKGDPSIMNDEAPKVFGFWELSVNRKPRVAKSIAAYNIASGKMLWEKKGGKLAYLAPLSLSAAGSRVFFLDNKDLNCVGLKSGRPLWQAPFPTQGLFLRNYAPTVVAHRDVVMCLLWNRLCAFSMIDGGKLWEQKGSIGFASPGDLFAIKGLAWSVPMTASIWRENKLNSTGKIVSGVPIPRDNFLGNSGSEIWGMDLHTGEVKKALPRSLLPTGHHHRCYRNKATERFLICGRRGVEYIDLAGDAHVNNWWLRGICQYGIMPANGFLYVPPDPCQCFNLIKVNGFNALSSGNSLDRLEKPDGPALEKGPGYGMKAAQEGKAEEAPANRSRQGLRWQPPVYPARPDEWPTYRGNITRSGSTKSAVSGKIRRKWVVDLGGALTQATIADGSVYVHDKDTHTLHCLDAHDGSVRWRFVSDGPVDSPPTLHDCLCLFGCRDGFMYCLNGASGKLVYRFRGAPCDMRVISDNRLESVWPISGSVLVQDGIAYFAAGRSSYLDGGIRVHGVDVHSGIKRHEATISANPRRPGVKDATEESIGALPDVLVSDGERINMRALQFDRTLKPFDASQLKTLFSATSLLEDSWMHRQNWCLGSRAKVNARRHAARVASVPRSPNAAMSQLLVFDGRFAYGINNPYSWLKYTKAMQPQEHDGHLHQKFSRYQKAHFPVGVRIQNVPNTAQQKKKAGSMWSIRKSIQPRAMVLAGGLLFMAGWLDDVAIRTKTGAPINPTTPDPRECRMWVLKTDSGGQVNEYPLESEPVFDGMSSAYGRLFLSLKNGKLACYGGSDAETGE